jgi:hypothetical protein
MQNRIKKLSKEEESLIKKIEETQKKADSIYQIKKRTAEKVIYHKYI